MNEHLRPLDAGAADPQVPRVPDAYAALIGTPERVSERLRRELRKRAEADDPAYEARTMSAGQLATLRAALARVIPQDEPAIDLAARVDTMMAEASGNGWRYEALPTDPEAYQVGLATLDALASAAHGQPFAALAGAQADALLRRVDAGEAGVEAADRFDAQQMRLWFEELRSDAARLYVGHPAVMARIGYSGIANGGPGGARFAGFQRIGIGEREAFEPILAGERETFEPILAGEREAFEPPVADEREAAQPTGTAAREAGR